MSFPTTIVDLTDGANDHDYDHLYSEGRKAVRKDIASTQDEPALLTIQHNESGSGENLIQNSVARFDREIVDTDGNRGTISAYVVIRNPLRVATAAEVLEVVKQLNDFLGTSTYAAQLINGEQ